MGCDNNDEQCDKYGTIRRSWWKTRVQDDRVRAKSVARDASSNASYAAHARARTAKCNFKAQAPGPCNPRISRANLTGRPTSVPLKLCFCSTARMPYDMHDRTRAA